MNAPVHERRSEIRRPASGPVSLSFADPLPVTVSGTLLDVSSGGFRAAHGNSSLRAGMDVDFAHAAASGKARVAWNRISGNRIETGFVVYRGATKQRRPRGPGRRSAL